MKASDLIVKLEDLLWTEAVGWRDSNVDIRLSGEAGPLTTVELKKDHRTGDTYIELGCDQ